MKIVLINPYELGRQPFGLAEPTAWLREAGFDVLCLDLSLQTLAPAALADADLIAIYVPMHTATRIALEALPRCKTLAPNAHLCAYGLYAPMNATLLHEAGAETILGGECEPGLLALAQRLATGDRSATPGATINLSKIRFIPPDRSGLPPLTRYAHLILPNGDKKITGFAEGSRGCKHLCRHCPVVPVYEGKFRIVPVDVVMADIRNQIDVGAQHVSFGDPDFLNGPAHAVKLVQALHAEFPSITYDATIKIQHIINHADLLPLLKATGCLFITTAVEAVDNEILARLAKNHTNADFAQAVALLHDVGISLAPTFVAFTPWTTLVGYRALLERLLTLRLIESVAPIQLAIRLLIPQGSYLLQLPGFLKLLQEFDSKILGYRWRHADARVDELQQRVQAWVNDAETAQLSRIQIFEKIWQWTHAALNEAAPPLPKDAAGEKIPHLSEPWYCCAEPTEQQLQSF